MRPSERVVLLAALGCAFAGCRHTVWFSYHFPRPGDPAAAAGTTCLERCRTEHRAVAAPRLACYRRCPGVRVSSGELCHGDADACELGSKVSAEAFFKAAAIGIGAVAVGAAAAAMVVGAAKLAGGRRGGSRSGLGRVFRAAVVGAAAAVQAGRALRRGLGPRDLPSCPRPKEPPPASECARRLPNQHHEERCAYFCLEHCRWHRPPGIPGP